MGVDGPVPPAGFPPTHCPSRPGRHRRALRGSRPGAGRYVETGNALKCSGAVRLAEPSTAWWTTPSDELRKYFRDFNAIPANRDKKRERLQRLQCWLGLLRE